MFVHFLFQFGFVIVQDGLQLVLNEAGLLVVFNEEQLVTEFDDVRPRGSPLVGQISHKVTH